MKILISSAIAGLLAAATPSLGATTTGHRSDMSCEEFLTLDDVMRPKIVYWAEGAKTKDKKQGAVIDVASIDQLVPIVVEQCRSEPRATLWDKLDASWDKLEASVKKHL